MTKLIIWRHGQTTWNSAGRIQGHADIALDATGRAQAAAAAAVLARTLQSPPARIVSSDLQRAYTTALALGKLLGQAVQTDKRLRERDFGKWEGLTRAEVTERYPESARFWRGGQPLAGHGIESHEDVTVRMAAAITDAVTDCSGPVIIVTHGGSARRALDTLIGIPGFTTAMSGLGNCRWAELHRHGDSWRLHTYNAGEVEVHG